MCPAQAVDCTVGEVATVSAIVTTRDPPSLRTSRLTLRQWQPADRPAFAALNADPRVMQYFPAPLSAEASDAMADRCAAGIRERAWGLWAAEVTGNTPFIGFIGLAHAAEGLPCSGLVEVGWRLAAEHWGRGYASEGAHAALDYAFETLGLAEVVSFTAVGNGRSRAVMERLGMHRAAAEFDHPHVPEDNALRRHVLYWVSRDDWRLRMRLRERGVVR